MPSDPAIYHITHVTNLTGIVRAGGLWCDSECIGRGVGPTNIGHRHIKTRRLQRAVTTRSGGKLGDYVPFNFCPRSVMLFVVDKGHDDYPGGQEEIVHLVSRVSVAVSQGRAWAFTDRHAELAHALHFDDLAQLDEVSWAAMPQTYWSDVKEERQAEFLVKEFFPWTAVVEVGVRSAETAGKVRSAMMRAAHQPPVVVRPAWYY